MISRQSYITNRIDREMKTVWPFLKIVCSLFSFKTSNEFFYQTWIYCCASFRFGLYFHCLPLFLVTATGLHESSQGQKTVLYSYSGVVLYQS